MASLREWIIRLWGTIRPNRQDADIEAELRFHVEMSVEQARRRSGETVDAMRIAAIRAGGLTHGMDAMRDQRHLPWLDDLAGDVRHGGRALLRSPLFTLVAGLTLALAIGANTAIFSLANAVLVRPLPVSHPHELITLRQRGPAGDVFPLKTTAASELARGLDAVSGLAAFRPALGTLVSVSADAELLTTQSVSGNYHAVLGVPALVGRTLVESDRDPVAVISHRYWQRRFAGDRAVAGRVLQIEGRTFTIVGVTPPEFFGTQPGRHVDVTTPLAARTTPMPPNARWLYVVGRLAPGVTRERAAAALRTRWAQLAGAGMLPAEPAVTLELDSGAQGLNELRREFSLPLSILMAAVGVVLLVACANLAGLFILRSSARHADIALRLSLGAGRGRVVRQLLTESALLAVGSGVGGVALAYWATHLLLAMMSRGRGPILLDVAPDGPTLAFALGITIITTVLFGLLPAVGASRANLQPGLKMTVPSGQARGSLGRMLVVAQVALLLLLLTSAALFTGSLHKLQAIDPGYQADHVLAVNVPRGQGDTQERTNALHEELYARFRALPSVQSVSLAMDTPPGELSMCGGIEVPGRPEVADEAPAVCGNFVGPRFFETMRIRLLAGREFEAGDDLGAPHRVIISESVARRYFGGEEPLGRQILVGTSAPPARVPASIVGIVEDVRYASPRADAPLMTYRPYRQDTEAPANTFLIRSSMAAEMLAPLLHAEVRAAAPTLPPPAVVSLEDRVAAVLVEERVLATLSVFIGALAAILAAIGVYSIVAASVARRTREIGLRLALGARPRQVAGMVVKEAFGIVGAGLAIGIPAAVVAGRAARDALGGVLFDLSPTDPLILLWPASGILLIASLAAYAPARRASRVDPVAAIKQS